MVAPAASEACGLARPPAAAPLRARCSRACAAAPARRLAPLAPPPLRRPRLARAVRPAAFFGRKDEAAGGEGGAKASGLVLVPAAVALPHPAKLAKGGEDAHFIRVSPQGGMLALADGVSGFQELGIDASLYSRKLLRMLADLSQADAATGDGAVAGGADTLSLLSQAQCATREPGASTAVVLALEGRTGTLRGTHVGDSGYRVLRNGALLHASEPQQHAFDCPLQLGCAKYIPDTDRAEAGITAEVALQEGDLLLVASDGLFDNMAPEEMLQVTAAAVAEAPPGADGAGAYAAAARVAAALAGGAADHSRDRGYDSPYARDARRNAEELRAAAGPLGALAAAFGGGGNNQPQPGGKLDDITVMAAFVIPASARATDAELAAAADAAAAALSAVPSAVGDAEQEGRSTIFFATEADEVAAAMAVKSAAAAERAAAFLPAFDASDVAAMDAPALRKALAAKGLPTSGKLEVLRARLAAVPA